MRRSQGTAGRVCETYRSVVSERYLSSLPENQTIIETLSPTPPVSCLRVKITEKVDDTHYKAIATLDNGNDIRIMIEDRGDKVQVSIPEQSGF